MRAASGTRFPDLRHFYASALIGAGLHPRAIQGRLGHATIAETMDTYGHLFPASEDHGREALDTLLGGAPVPWMRHDTAGDLETRGHRRDDGRVGLYAGNRDG